MRTKLSIICMLFILVMSNVSAKSANDLTNVRYGVENVDGVDIFYREAGDPTKQAVVLLHGFPSSSHQYRVLLSNLGDDFYLFAPDYPGYGDSAAPSVKEYTYTFDNLSITMEALLKKRGLNSYVMVIHDFGAPVGLRIASRNTARGALTSLQCP